MPFGCDFDLSRSANRGSTHLKPGSVGWALVVVAFDNAFLVSLRWSAPLGTRIHHPGKEGRGRALRRLSARRAGCMEIVLAQFDGGSLE